MTSIVLAEILGGSRLVMDIVEAKAPVVVEIAVLVFREGLESVLVLAAVTAGFKRERYDFRRPIAAGVGAALLATILTWFLAVRLLDRIGKGLSGLALQAATGLVAIVVLLIVMNWFFHGLYWTGWISFHNRRKQELIAHKSEAGEARFLYGMALLGFTSLYREGFEVVLFLQNYRLKFGSEVVGYGVVLGSLAATVLAFFTFLVQSHLPYRRMLVATGAMLVLVLLVMVGEEAQEMQLARWLPVTDIPRLSRVIPSWMGLWFSVFPTVETLGAQALAALLVFGSFFTARSSLEPLL